MIAPTLAGGTPTARLVAAEARIRKGEGGAARMALGPLADPAAAAVRARAFALDGAFADARTALVRGGIAPGADYAWPSGAWSAVAGDPGRETMAAWMAGADAAPADPAALTSGEAFRQPLPALDRPSLGAARQLLAAGPQVGGFVQGVLAGD
jgi:hypothetical protein